MEDGRAYLDKHQLEKSIKDAVSKVLRERPSNPQKAVAEILAASTTSDMKNDYPKYGKEGAEDIDMFCMTCEDNTVQMTVVEAKRRALGEFDVHLEMKYCGICHTDIHFTKNDLGMAVYPMCPGHELAGVAVAVGSKVTKFKVGDQVGIGCFVDCCLECDQCLKGDEQYCRKGTTFTYGGADQHGRSPVGSGPATFGGYSTQMVIHERFAIKIPASFPLEYAGPVMCAGITMYDPLKHWGIKAGSRVGIVGLGGLGTMGVKLAKAMGATVTVISRSEAKKEYATKIGCDKYIAMSDAEAVTAGTKTLDLILDTISSNHPVMGYHGLLDINGHHVLLGLSMDLGSVPAVPMLFGRTGIGGSIIGGIANTQELIDLCAEKNIKPEISVVGPEEVPSVYEKLHTSNDAGVRYVLDCSKLAAAVGTKYPAPKLE